MSRPESFRGRLRIPAVAAPMFLASGPELVINCCKSGVVGTFPALNQRSSEGFEQWLIQISEALAADEQAAPWGVNLIVHKSNPRLQADLALCIKYKVPLIITSLGAVKDLVDAIHGYGGLVFHDIINLRHARKAASAGVDGLIGVAAGAGGHAGTLSPFALVAELRQFFEGTILLSGCLSTGRDIAAAELMGADLAYMGTRFINTAECLVSPQYKQMIAEAAAADVMYTPHISGVHANFLRQSIINAGMDPEALEPVTEIDFGQELTVDADQQGEKRKGAWTDIWSAGQGVGSVDDYPPAAELISRLCAEYHSAIAEQQGNAERWFATKEQQS